MQKIDPPTETLAIEPDREHPDVEAPATPAVPAATVFTRRKQWAALLKSKALSSR